jgi:hypothetical protein
MAPEAATAPVTADLGLPGGSVDFSITEPAVNAKSLSDNAATNRIAQRARAAEKVAAGIASPAAPDAKAAADASAAEELIPPHIRAMAKNVPPREAAAASDVAEPPAVDATTPPAETVAQPGTQTPEESRIERVMRASKMAKASASRNRQLMADVARMEREHEATRGERERFRAEAEQGRNLANRLNADPLAALTQLGITPDNLVERVMRAGTPDEKIAAINAQLEQERNARNQLEQRIKNERFQSEFAAAEAACWSKAQDAERYPNLQSHPKEMLLSLVKSVAIEARQRYIRETGTAPVIKDSQILRYLNTRYAPKDAAASQVSPKAAKAAPPASLERPGKAKSPGKAPRTLTSDVVNGGTSRPGNWESLSRADRMAVLKGR